MYRNANHIIIRIILILLFVNLVNAALYCACLPLTINGSPQCSQSYCSNVADVTLTPTNYCSVLDGLICRCDKQTGNNRNCNPCGCYKRPVPSPETIYIDRPYPVEIPVFINSTVQVPVELNTSCNHTYVYLNKTVEIPVYINNTVFVNDTIYETIYLDNNCTGFEIIEEQEIIETPAECNRQSYYVVTITVLSLLVLLMLCSILYLYKKTNETATYRPMLDL
jgi:hypothetical protein